MHLFMFQGGIYISSENLSPEICTYKADGSRRRNCWNESYNALILQFWETSGRLVWRQLSFQTALSEHVMSLHSKPEKRHPWVTPDQLLPGDDRASRSDLLSNYFLGSIKNEAGYRKIISVDEPCYFRTGVVQLFYTRVFLMERLSLPYWQVINSLLGSFWRY